MSGSPLGDRGEALAAEFLQARGWSILDRNYRVGRKEVDLVAHRGGVVAFIEVKTRSSERFGHPLDAITARKQREISEVATAWLVAHGRTDAICRYDAVAVTFASDSTPVIKHLEDAWGI